MPLLLATWPYRCRHLLLNALAFGLCYPLANLLALQHGITRGIALPFERSLPFLAWMIVPYACSGLLFCLCFMLVRSQAEVAVLSRRLLLATVTASLIFIVFPLHFQWPRPPVNPPWLAALFQLLAQVDRPYNQFPSLHVAYCVIFWVALHTRARQSHALLRPALAGLLLLVACSTLFTYQHHLLDVAGGLALGLLATASLPQTGNQHPPVALYYLLAAMLLAGLGIAGCPALTWLCLTGLLYGCTSLLLVSLAYARGDRHFLHKRHGRYPCWIWLLYAPYLAGYRLTWLLVRLREHGQPPCRQLAPLLWVGRRLSQAEARQLPPDCMIVDLANEICETPLLRRAPYHHVALLDLTPLPDAAIEPLLTLIAAAVARGQPVYLHCAMGYSRSRHIYRRYTAKIGA